MDDKKEVMVSPEGLKKLEEELEYLKTSKRREVQERLKEARSHGDLSENSEYDDARNEQAFVEGRIATLEKTLRNAKVIDSEIASEHGVVRLGSTVKLKDLEFGDEVEYTIVGTVEANPREYKISHESPVGKAILGQRPGTTVNVEAPGGLVQFHILDVR